MVRHFTVLLPLSCMLSLVGRASPPCPWEDLRVRAVAEARRALADGTDEAVGRYRLESRGERHGFAFVPGPKGAADGALAFADGANAVCFRGFSLWTNGRMPVTNVSLRVRLSEDRGTVRLRFSGVGLPADATVALGPADVRLTRAYGGFGYVLENPRDFEVPGGSRLGARHVGADYANGLSVVQVTDRAPLRLLCAAVACRYALVTSVGATLTLTPSSKGAFAAARRFGATARPGHDVFGGVEIPEHGEPETWVTADCRDDAERVPWHDIVSHGRTVLVGGGLEETYAGKGRARDQGYGTDDYLCTTVMGGRAPVCPAVMPDRSRYTQSILGDLMRDFGQATFESLTFGPTIHQMHVVFSNGCEAWVNRSRSDSWDVPGWTLPPLGFYAKSPKHESGIVVWDTRRIRFSEKKVYNP